MICEHYVDMNKNPVSNDLPKSGRSAIENAPKFAETALILLKHLQNTKFSGMVVEILQKRFVRRFVCQMRPSAIHFYEEK